MLKKKLFYVAVNIISLTFGGNDIIGDYFSFK